MGKTPRKSPVSGFSGYESLLNSLTRTEYVSEELWPGRKERLLVAFDEQLEQVIYSHNSILQRQVQDESYPKLGCNLLVGALF